MAAKKKTNVIQTTGRRKTAIARATLKTGKGIVKVNSMLLNNFSNNLARARITEPLLLAGDLSKKVDINVKVECGGWQGQANAVRLAIARALAGFDSKLKKVFLEYDRNLMVADVRFKEKCKPNDSKARAKRQKSYR